MSYRLTRAERRIIEQSKIEGAELSQRMNSEVGASDGSTSHQKTRSKLAPLVSTLIFIVIFVVLAFLIKLGITWLSQ